MTEAELDEVAFLSGGDSSAGRQTRNGVAVCSQKRALCVTAIVLGALFGTALVIAYAGPQNDCACAGKMPPGYVPETLNNTQPFNPIATNGEPFPWHKNILPNNVRPNRYTLTIHPNLTTFDVKGQVTIEFHVEKETNFIVLHSHDLNITEKAIVGPKGFALKIVKYLEYPPNQQIYIELKDKLRKKTNFTLNLRWYSKLETEPEGFYVDQYDDDYGLKRYLAATVFRPGYARRAFPCFDEPHLRAPFRISVFRDRFHIGLSNSIVHATDDVGFYMGTGLLRDDFIETPPLPPDDIAWIVSDFQRKSLDPSPTYQQTLNPVTQLPYQRRTQPPTTTSFRSHKLPINHILTNALTKPLKTMQQNGNHHPHPPVPLSSTSLINNHHNNLTLSNNSLNNSTTNGSEINGKLENLITTAPSYTFYASAPVLNRSDFLLNTSRDVLEHLQVWLGVPYPLAKLDFVALPSLDREMISSLGLITLQAAFLQERDALTTDQYHMSAIKISEAIIKQFLGGMTSPKIWKHFWLWEGLIKYLGRLVLVPLQPLWPMEEMHLMHISTKALDIDAIEGRESLMQGTVGEDEHELDEFFVDKSASVMAMLNSAIGEQQFRGCLGAFLRAYKFQTSEPIDLWSICTKRINNTRNIKEMMNLWTNHDGFPLLTVTKIGSSVSISQKQFAPMEFLAILDESLFLNATNNEHILIDSSSSMLSSTTSTTIATTTTTTVAPASNGGTSANGKKVKPPIKWTFPVSYITDVENITDTIWFHSTDVTFQIPNDIQWIKMNAGQMGYYRVLYDDENWIKIIDELKKDHETFMPVDRIGLISDGFTLCHANLMPCNITLNLISYLPNELNWGPITTSIKHLERWRRILKYSECFLMLTEFVKSILAKPMAAIGWNNDGKDEIRLLRPEVLLASVLWEDFEAINHSKQILHYHMQNGTEIPANLKEVVYTGAVLSGEYIYWQHCWTKYTQLISNPDGAVERLQLLRALGKTKDAWLQNRLLSHVVTLPMVEVIQVLEAISGTPTGGAMACRFLQAKWYDLQTKMGMGSIHFAKAISAITQYGATKFDYDELKSLVHRFGDGPGMRTLNMTLRSVAANVEWVYRSQMQIFNFVNSNDHIH